MSAIVAITAGQWVLIAAGALVAVIGFGLAAANILPVIAKARPRGSGEPRPLIGKPQQLSRRKFFGRAMLLGFVGSLTSFGGVSLAFLWPNLRGGFGGKIALSAPADDIKRQIAQNKQPFYYAPGRFYIVEYDAPESKAKIYTENETGALTAGGLMALYQRCVHLGCRVPFCPTSQWFECPCHGSKYNRAGEFKGGPAPRGLDRFPITVENGIVTVDTGLIVTGPPRGTNTTGQEAEGPFCTAAGAAESEH